MSIPRATSKVIAIMIVSLCGYTASVISALVQTSNNVLRGISTITVLIEDLGNQSNKCNVDKKLIYSSAMHQFSAAKFTITNNARTTFYINVNPMYVQNADSCVFTVETEAYTLQEVNIDASGRTAFAKLSLWNNGYMGIWNRGDVARQISAAVESQAKHFVTDWNLDNK
jgi:hypothetical protein